MSKMDPAFFKPFIDATLNTLKVACQLEGSPEKPFFKGKAPQPEFEIAGVIGITSDAFTGSITLCFPAKVYLTIMSNMLGETYTVIDKELQDGAGELLNIIFGNAKATLNEKGHTIAKAIPTVIRGTNLQTTYVGKSPVVVLPFKTSAGPFNIEICTEEVMAS